MDALKRTVSKQPPKDKFAQISAFARVLVALRVHAIYTRAARDHSPPAKRAAGLP
jgi:hypothetical protein